MWMDKSEYKAGGSMSTTIDKIGDMSVDELNKLRVNAKQRLLKSESDENASAILDASFANRVARQSSLASFEKVFAPAVVQIIVDAFPAA